MLRRLEMSEPVHLPRTILGRPLSGTKSRADDHSQASRRREHAVSLSIEVVDTDELIAAAGALQKESMYCKVPGARIIDPVRVLNQYANDLLRCASYIRHLEALLSKHGL
jgi:hypothetical protein